MDNTPSNPSQPNPQTIPTQSSEQNPPAAAPTEPVQIQTAQNNLPPQPEQPVTTHNKKSRILIVIAGLVLVVGVLAGVFLMTNKNKSLSKETSVTSPSDTEKVSNVVVEDACQILTQQIAAKLLGEGSVRSEDDQKNNITNSDGVTSNCTYEIKDSKNKGQSTKSIILQVRSPKNEQTAKGIRDIFGQDKEVTSIMLSGVKTKVQNISNLGDKAYFAPLNQAWILKNSNLYIVYGLYNGSFYTQSEIIGIARQLKLQ